VIISGIAAGMFVANPGRIENEDFGSCAWCDFKRVCHTDRFIQLERKSGDPALQRYLRMKDVERQILQ